jgi:hypothetical protein
MPDLRTWIREQHVSLIPMFQLGVQALVPVERMADKPARGSNSIAWTVWHLARTEDVVVNTVIRGDEQLFDRDDWGARLGVSDSRIGTGFSDDEVSGFSAEINPSSLIEYWTAVSRSTSAWLDEMPLEMLDEVPDLRKRLKDARQIVTESASWIYGAWGHKTVSYLLRGPVISHGFIHLGEMQSTRGQLGIKGV